MKRWIKLLLVSQWITAVAGGADDTRWLNGEGLYFDQTKWSHGLPSALSTAWLRGKSVVHVPRMEHAAVAGMWRIATAENEDATLLIEGGQVVSRREFVLIGEAAGSKGTVVIEDGAFHVVSSVYLGGAGNRNTSRCRGTLRIRGGSLVCRLLTLGWGQQDESVLAIEGSGATAVHMLDYLTLGNPMAGTPGSQSTLAFALDAQGVTPVTIQSNRTGLSINRSAVENRCQLQISLLDVPPRDDVTLVAQQVATRGTFDDLPEGAEVTATHAGITYTWNLSYRGGKSGCDVVLTKVRGHMGNAQITKCRDIPEKPEPLWTSIPARKPEVLMDATLAFPGAEGFGRHASGGRGGQLVEVTSLADNGPGSLRAALDTKGPRVVVFKIAGEVKLKDYLSVREPFLTVDGQSSPPGGITITGGGLVVQTHDVILRHLRIRPGDSTQDNDALNFSDASRCIADHLSLSWATDETLSVTGISDEITVQWCIISESLNREKHAYASVAGGERVTWHHNLFAHHVSRVPRFAGIVSADFRNNVLYNWGHTAGYGQFERVNYVGNYLKPGPNTTQKPLLVHLGEVVADHGSFHLSGNLLEGQDEVKTGFDREVMAMKPFHAPPVTTSSAKTAFQSVLKEAGATPERRDATDARVVHEVRSGQGRIINVVADTQN
jgi:pectate lyase